MSKVIPLHVLIPPKVLENQNFRMNYVKGKAQHRETPQSTGKNPSPRGTTLKAWVEMGMGALWGTRCLTSFRKVDCFNFLFWRWVEFLLPAILGGILIWSTKCFAFIVRVAFDIKVNIDHSSAIFVHKVLLWRMSSFPHSFFAFEIIPTDFKTFSLVGHVLI